MTGAVILGSLRKKADIGLWCDFPVPENFQCVTGCRFSGNKEIVVEQQAAGVLFGGDEYPAGVQLHVDFSCLSAVDCLSRLGSFEHHPRSDVSAPTKRNGMRRSADDRLARILLIIVLQLPRTVVAKCHHGMGLMQHPVALAVGQSAAKQGLESRFVEHYFNMNEELGMRGWEFGMKYEE